MRILLLFTLLISVTAQECRVSNGVEYVKIDGNFQPDGCPDGLKCLNNVCSTVTKAQNDATATVTEDGKEGDVCKVTYMPAEGGVEARVIVLINGVQKECTGGRKCLGDFAEDLLKQCTDDNKKCTNPESLKGTCQNPETFIMGGGWWTIFIIIGIIVLLVLCWLLGCF